ncbi:hypothetical protein [Aquimarina intermedia]|uniref:Uncharacterized protein n=1 Tax=Aquimarina intermedia TaxID=350814 RepID=A0A5S5BYL1_9FLAO|nr:hypothetical protein [Aquimarina intermedia]TYP71428.1 hypothetical protein BD809_10910 [Aquimarina intermedia]
MKNSLTSVKGLKILDKATQSVLKGGVQQANRCPRGCYDHYFLDVDGSRCAVPNNNGGVCYGTVQNDQCCM